MTRIKKCKKNCFYICFCVCLLIFMLSMYVFMMLCIDNVIKDDDDKR